MTPRATVLLLPGFGGSPAQPVLVRLSERLTALGFTCLRLSPPRGRLTPGLEREVAWLEGVLEGQGGRQILVGRSFGARVVARVAARRRLHRVVALGYPLRPPGKRRPLDEAALRETKTPTLIVQGAKDPLGPLRVLRAVTAGAPLVEVVPLAGAGHAFGRREPEALDAVVAWLDRATPRR